MRGWGRVGSLGNAGKVAEGSLGKAALGGAVAGVSRAQGRPWLRGCHGNVAVNVIVINTVLIAPGGGWQGRGLQREVPLPLPPCSPRSLFFGVPPVGMSSSAAASSCGCVGSSREDKRDDKNQVSRFHPTPRLE